MCSSARTAGLEPLLGQMQWPTVTEMFTVSAHRQAEPAPWQVAPPAAAAPGAQPSAPPSPHDADGPTEAATEPDAW
jgi:hypothetical protein